MVVLMIEKIRNDLANLAVDVGVVADRLSGIAHRARHDSSHLYGAAPDSRAGKDEKAR